MLTAFPWSKPNLQSVVIQGLVKLVDIGDEVDVPLVCFVEFLVGPGLPHPQLQQDTVPDARVLMHHHHRFGSSCALLRACYLVVSVFRQFRVKLPLVVVLTTG